MKVDRRDNHDLQKKITIQPLPYLLGLRQELHLRKLKVSEAGRRGSNRISSSTRSSSTSSTAIDSIAFLWKWLEGKTHVQKNWTAPIFLDIFTKQMVKNVQKLWWWGAICLEQIFLV